RNGWAEQESKPLAVNAKQFVAAMTDQTVLNDARQREGLAELLVSAASSLSMQTPVYALIAALLSQPAAAAEGPVAAAAASGDAAAASGGVAEGKGAAANGGGSARDGGRGGGGGDDAEPAPSFGRLIVDGVCGALTEALVAGAFIRAKMLLRFLGELANVHLVRYSELGDVLAAMSALYVEGDDPAIKQPCRDLVAYCVAAALPWCGPGLYRHWPAGLSRLVDALR
ncbi:unnamed protein product, partial [Phaeothamnion confervicola]